MQSAKPERYWISYVPGLVITTLAIYLAKLEGGWIFAIIVAAWVIPSLLIAYTANFALLKYHPPKNRYWAALIGLFLYVLVTGAVLILLDQFGPSQIM